MECKGSILTYIRGTFLELIETLWNVKKERAVTERWNCCRINRNIVECKGKQAVKEV